MRNKMRIIFCQHEEEEEKIEYTIRDKKIIANLMEKKSVAEHDAEKRK